MNMYPLCGDYSTYCGRYDPFRKPENENAIIIDYEHPWKDIDPVCPLTDDVYQMCYKNTILPFQSRGPFRL
jgi:hypothetical protein